MYSAESKLQVVLMSVEDGDEDGEGQGQGGMRRYQQAGRDGCGL